MLAKLLNAIRAARPGMNLFARSIVEAILLAEGSIGTANVVARQLGLRNRFQLARVLKHEGLPPLHVMAEWATVLSWVCCAERQGLSLCWMAFHAGRHPSACYRLVKEVTGLCWDEVRTRGSSWVLQQFLRSFERAALRPLAQPSPSCHRDRARHLVGAAGGGPRSYAALRERVTAAR
jgi:hypothetical protein